AGHGLTEEPEAGAEVEDDRVEAGRLDAHAGRVAAVSAIVITGARGGSPDTPEREVHHVDDPRLPTSAGTVPKPAVPMSGVGRTPRRAASAPRHTQPHALAASPGGAPRLTQRGAVAQGGVGCSAVD